MFTNLHLRKSLLCAAILLLPALAWAQVSSDWIKRYTGSTDGSVDQANALALNTSGQAHVTGTSGEDYVTIRYNSDGSRKWLVKYNGTGKGRDEANAIAVDANGNVYVTGSSLGSGSGSDYATVKYDKDGNQKWAKRYNGPGNGEDVATGIAVDGSGNVYVTGWSGGSGTGSDYATIRYDKDGNQKWVKRHTGPGNEQDRAKAIGLDGSGNVVVTGDSKMTSNSDDPNDIVTIKYSSGGTQQWLKRYYKWEADGFDQARDLALDASGNIYVTGASGFEDQGNYTTLKYSSGGELKWAASYNNDDYDISTSIAVDGNGNVYVTGTSSDEDHPNSVCATLKYNSSGELKWAEKYAGEPGTGHNAGKAIALDKGGNVYVTGRSFLTASDDDYITIKYNSSGDRQWLQRFDGTGKGHDEATALAVDGSGNVLVTGISTGSGTGDDILSIRYTPTGASAAPPVTTGREESILPGSAGTPTPLLFGVSHFPNPAAATVIFDYTLPYGGQVSLKIYDLLGREAAAPVQASAKEGFYRVSFDVSGLRKGLYFYRLTLRSDQGVRVQNGKMAVEN